MNSKKTAQQFVQYLKKMSISADFEKNENRRMSVTGAYMHIFQKFKKQGLEDT